MFFLLLIAITTQKLKIIEPSKLRNEVGSEIKYSVASFGKIPWGHRMLGHLDKATPELACEELPVYQAQSEFLLVKRGECTFVTKVKNAQAAGYQMVIVGGSTDEVTSNFTMADDGNGFQISIPSIFIGKKDAETLQLSASNPNDEQKQVLLLMKFDVKQRQNVDIIFALDIEDLESFRIIKEFREYYTKLKNDSVHFSLMFHMYQIPAEQESDDCLCSGRYCAFKSERKEFGSGQDIVRETQRQLCLFNLDPEGYFKYLSAFSIECTAPISYDICSIKVMRNLQLQYDEVLNCFSDSFVDLITQNPTKNFTNAYNLQLDQQIRFNQFLGIQTFPAVMINDQFFQGEISGKAVFGGICNGFIEPPKSCLEEVDGQIKFDQSQQTAQLINLIVILLSILIIVGAVGFMVCRKIFKTNQKETEVYVNEMVNQYIKFSEGKNTQSHSQ